MRKHLLACAVALCLPITLVACGGEEPPDEPVVSDQTAPPADPWYPEDDEGGGAPNGGSIFDPCSRASCWDGDRRSWIINPPWDNVMKQPGVPQTDNGLPAKKPPVMNGGQQH